MPKIGRFYISKAAFFYLHLYLLSTLVYTLADLWPVVIRGWVSLLNIEVISTRPCEVGICSLVILIGMSLQFDDG